MLSGTPAPNQHGMKPEKKKRPVYGKLKKKIKKNILCVDEGGKTNFGGNLFFVKTIRKLLNAREPHLSARDT